jgi:hypothetical protein
MRITGLREPGTPAARRRLTVTAALTVISFGGTKTAATVTYPRAGRYSFPCRCYGSAGVAGTFAA